MEPLLAVAGLASQLIHTLLPIGLQCKQQGLYSYRRLDTEMRRLLTITEEVADIGRQPALFLHIQQPTNTHMLLCLITVVSMYMKTNDNLVVLLDL